MVVVSVIVPVYNTMQWLTDCVESIRSQTLKNIEIILVDDGSTDYSGVICDAYAEVDSRIKVIHQENRGVSAARNAGIDIATGKYIMFCDSDDYVAPEWCSSAVELAIQHPDAMIILPFEQADWNGVYGESYSGKENISVLRYGDYAGVLESLRILPVWNKIFRKDIIEQFNIRFHEECSYGEDFLFVAAYLGKAKYIVEKKNQMLYLHRCWSANALSTCFLGTNYFRYCIREAKIMKRFIANNEAQEFFMHFFWNRGIGSLAHVLDSRNPDSLDKQKRDCQQIMSSKDFREWCGAALATEPGNPLIQLLMQGNIEKAYEPVLQYLRQTGRGVSR